MTELKKVDETFVFEPVDPNHTAARIENARNLSINFTDLGATIKVSDNAKFEKSKPWGKKYKTKKLDENGMENPEVYFSFTCSSNAEPQYLLNQVIHEWRRNNGRKLELSALACFETQTVIVCYNISNDGNQNTLLDEAMKFLLAAQKFGEENTVEGQFPFKGMVVPALTMRSGVPKIPGVDQSGFNDWGWEDLKKRNALHIECATEHVAHVQALVKIAKDDKLVEIYWDPNARLSNVIGQRGSKRRGTGEDETKSHFLLDKHKSYSKRHLCYQASMVVKGLEGIMDVDKYVPIYRAVDTSQVMAQMNLRGILYNMKMPNEHSLFAEVHQGGPMMSVDVVIGNTLAAEAMVEMINKNIAAYLTYFLPTIGCSKEFIKDLLSAAVDPSLLHEVEYCTWEEKTLALTTPKDVEKAKNKSIEDAAWYQNNFGVHMEKKEKKRRSTWLLKTCTNWMKNTRMCLLMIVLENMQARLALQLLTWKRRKDREKLM